MKNFIDPEKRTVEQDLKEQGVFETTTIEGVKWAKRHGGRKDSKLVNLTRNGVFFPSFIADDLGERIMVGTGRYKGRLVLLFKFDSKGYMHYSQKERGNKRNIASKNLADSLISAGAKTGFYEPVKIRGGWMCEEVRT